MGNYRLISVIKISCIICLLASLFSNAAGDWRRGKKDQSSDNKRIEETYLDTLNRGQEVSLIEEDTPEGPEDAPKTTEVSESKKSVDGFRIQLMASTSLENLRAKKDAIASELNMKIYIEHDEPYYKVYAGDFTQREQADKALVKVKESGYPDAWIVKTKVFADK